MGAARDRRSCPATPARRCSRRRRWPTGWPSKAASTRRTRCSTAGSGIATRPRPGSGYVLLTLKARLLEAHGEMAQAGELFRRSADVSLAEGLLVVAGMALAGLARVQYLRGSWDDAVVSAAARGGRGDRVRGPLGGRAGAVGRSARWRARAGTGRAWSAGTTRCAPSPRPSNATPPSSTCSPRRSRRRRSGRPTCSSTCARSPRCTPTSPCCPGSPCRRRRSWTSGASTKPPRSSARREALAAARRYPLLAARLAHARAQLAIAHHTPEAAIEPWSARGRRCRRSRCRTSAR